MTKSASIAGLVFGSLWLATFAHAEGSGRSMLSSAQVKGGLVVHLGCGDGKLTAELYGAESYLVYGLDTRWENVCATHEYLRSPGLCGRVSIDQFDGRSLPLVGNLASFVVAKQTAVSTEEILRVLHPYGVAFVDGRKMVKPKPEAIDEWTHFLRDADNNPVAYDSLIGSPRHMQFLAAPLWSRHHNRLASISTVVTAKGRLFYINVSDGSVFVQEDGETVCLDAASGEQRWRTGLATRVEQMKETAGPGRAKSRSKPRPKGGSPARSMGWTCPRKTAP